MHRKAFKMFLLPGFDAEYARRHDLIWPDLVELLHKVGIQNYSIFLDSETLTLFAYLEAPDLRVLDSLPAQEVMRRWWEYMGDIMQVNSDNSPVSIDLQSVFYLH